MVVRVDECLQGTRLDELLSPKSAMSHINTELPLGVVMPSGSMSLVKSDPFLTVTVSMPAMLEKVIEVPPQPVRPEWLTALERG